MDPSREEALATLRAAFSERKLSLFLGAGVSIGTGLPAWDKLVLAMYFDTVSGGRLEGWRPFPNYLYAIAEWYLDNLGEPLEITARKLRQALRTSEGRDDGDPFLRLLRDNLYAGLITEYGDGYPLDPDDLRHGNATLNGVARLCEATIGGDAGRGHGVSGVVTYNYDNLLETVTRGRVVTSIRRGDDPTPEDSGVLPIYHVHGFVPFDMVGASRSDEIVFTEDQYHLAARDSYSWANIVQMTTMSATVGLMVGLSLSDRNIRRLLDAVARSPLPPRTYALMPRPKERRPASNEVKEIDKKARKYLKRFERSGIKRRGGGGGREGIWLPPPGIKGDGGVFDSPKVKAPSRMEAEILGIIAAVERRDGQMQDDILRELGVTPIWYDNHAEIPDILAAIHE